jgi:hypothetical protein
MKFGPVIIRELRAEARRPFNYWLRVIGVAALLAGVWLALRAYDQEARSISFATATWTARGPIPAGFKVPAPISVFGAALFGYCNAALFAGLWILVPLLTADCISRERREGTLGLLFLTPLSASGVVVGKSLVHGLRAVTLYVTVLPILAVPLLFGGVSAKDLQLALLLDSSALVLALSAGLLASCLARDWLRVVILAEVFSFILALLFMNAHEHVIRWAARNALPLAPAAAPGLATPAVPWAVGIQIFGETSGHDGVLDKLERLFEASTNLLRAGSAFYPWGTRTAAPGGPWSAAWTNCPAAMHSAWFWGARGLLAFSLAWLGVAVGLAASHVRRAGRSGGPSAKAEQLRQSWCTPVLWQHWLRRRLNAALQRNPIGWLAQYSWQTRLTKWGWCLFVVLGECLLANHQRDFAEGHFYLAGVLLAGLALSASLGFRRELELRVLELVVVSPLTPLQIVSGRMSAIWRQFLPAVLVLFLAAHYGDWDRNWHHRGFFTFVVAVGWLFATLPVFGVYFSLFRWSILAPWLATCVCGLVLPSLAGRFLQIEGASPGGALLLALFVQGAAVCITFSLAVGRLARRRFALA